MSDYQPGAVLNRLHTFFLLIFTTQHSLVRRKPKRRLIREFAQGHGARKIEDWIPGLSICAELPNHLLSLSLYCFLVIGPPFFSVLFTLPET